MHIQVEWAILAHLNSCSKTYGKIPPQLESHINSATKLPWLHNLTFPSLHFLKWKLEKKMVPTSPSVRVDSVSSVQFSCSVVSDPLWPHELQHARPLCPSPTPGVYSNSCPSSRWCHPTISSSVVPSSSCPQSLPASGLFQWVNSSHEVVKVLEFQLQHQSFQWTPRIDVL